MVDITTQLDNERMYNILKAISTGMTAKWEFQERFGGSMYALNKLSKKGLVHIGTRNTGGYSVTEAGKKWMEDYKNGNIKIK